MRAREYRQKRNSPMEILKKADTASMRTLYEKGQLYQNLQREYDKQTNKLIYQLYGADFWKKEEL
jgi:hypothetical protein